MLTMTNNQYVKFLEDSVSRVYQKDSNYTFADYSRDADQVEIIPFEINSKNEKLKALINGLCSTDEVQKDCTVYRGHTPKDNIYFNLQDVGGFKDIEGGNFYSCAYQNESELTTASYCEGDICIKVYNKKEAFENEVKRIEKFYREDF